MEKKLLWCMVREIRRLREKGKLYVWERLLNLTESMSIKSI